MAYDEQRKPNEWEWRVKGEQAICKKKQPIQTHPRKLTWQWKTTSVMLVSGRVQYIFKSMDCNITMLAQAVVEDSQDWTIST